MNELDTIERIKRKIPVSPGSGIIVGVGDDCAVLRLPGAEEDLLLTTDMLLEDVHFQRRTHPADAAGHKALARPLSDIASMGGAPRFCLVSLALAPWTDSRWLDGFYRGLLRLGRQTGTRLAGGDLARGRRLACDVAVLGVVPRGKALRRDRARPGDSLYVSGRLGGAALGLKSGRGEAFKLHLRPSPRLELGRFLRERLSATAAIDLSDGLSLDLHRLCRASGVAASIELALPLFRGADLDQALHGGEDYELLFTAPPGVRPPSEHNGIPLTRIGTIRKGKPGAVDFLGRPLAPLGYDHFLNR